MKRSCINSNSIHEDLLIEILSRLPLESLHKFKWVSKSWFSIITEEILPKITQSPLMGFFYSVLCYRPLDVPPSNNGHATDFFRYVEPNNNNNNIGIDLTLSFLPSCYQHLSIVDCCNGLVLFSSVKFEGKPTKAVYLVCNPITKSWTELPHIDHCYNSILVFDPRVSPHYKVVTRLYGNMNWVFNIYYSETGRSERRSLVDCSSPAFSINIGGVRNYAFCHGAVYIDCRHRIIRVGSLGGENIVPELIKLPEGTERALCQETCIGTSVDKLCFAYIKGVWIRVWTLGGKCGNKWATRHDCRLHRLGGYDRRNPPRVVGFHPSSLDEVFILFNGVIFMYDLKNMRLNENYRIGSESQEVWMASLFFFSPCSAALLENQSES